MRKITRFVRRNLRRAASMLLIASMMISNVTVSLADVAGPETAEAAYAYAASETADTPEVTEISVSESVPADGSVSEETPAAEGSEEAPDNAAEADSKEAVSGDEPGSDSDAVITDGDIPESTEAGTEETVTAEDTAETEAEESESSETETEETLNAEDITETEAEEGESTEADGENTGAEAGTEESAADEGTEKAETEESGKQEGEPVSKPADEKVLSEKKTNEPFIRTKTVGNVKIVVSANPGVFPDNAKLNVSVVKKNSDEMEMIDVALEDVRDQDANIASSYVYDIKIVDEEGNELQPDTEYGSVNVAFEFRNGINSFVNADVYHLTHENGVITDTEKLEITDISDLPEIQSQTVSSDEPAEKNVSETADEKAEAEETGDPETDASVGETETSVKEEEPSETESEEEETADDPEEAAEAVSDIVTVSTEEIYGDIDSEKIIAVTTDSFSYYVVEFTYGDLRFVLEGGSSVLLSDILAEFGLTGTVSTLVISNDTLFECTASGDDYLITALAPFNWEEWMKVTVDGTTFTIKLTDSGTGVYFIVDTDKLTRHSVFANGVPKTIYCLEYKKAWPTETAGPYYESIGSSSFLTDDQLAVLRKLMYAGYPHDTQGFLHSAVNAEYPPEWADYIYEYYTPEITQTAIWEQMARWGFAYNEEPQTAEYYLNNMEMGYAVNQLLEYANTPGEVVIPSDTAVIIDSAGAFTKTSEGTWRSAQMKITEPVGFSLYYELHTPAGVTAVDEHGTPITHVLENTAFYLLADSAAAVKGKTFSVSAEFSWPTEVSAYETDAKAPKTNKPYQTMLSVEKDSMIMSGSLVLDAETDASGSIVLHGTKEVLGGRNKVIGNGEFRFTVTDAATGTVMAEGVTENTGSASSTTIKFDEIKYTTIDMPADPAKRDKNTHYGVVDGQKFHYLVAESESGAVPGIVYSADSFNVTVTVKDNGDNTLTATAAYSKAVKFENIYKAELDYELKGGIKTLQGRHVGIEGDEFQFEIRDITDYVHPKHIGYGYTDEAGLSGDGIPKAENGWVSTANIRFDKLHYTEADAGKTFVYEVTEVKGTASGITYNTTGNVWRIRVKITDNGDGTLKAEATTVHGSPSFKNSYKATGHLNLTGHKYLLGNRSKGVQAGEFEFAVKDTALGTVVATGKTLEGGQIEFTPVIYANDTSSSTAGAYTYHNVNVGDAFKYEVTETTASSGAITSNIYSDVYTVNVKISKGENGKLEADIVSIENHGAAAGAIEFTNRYKASGKLQISGLKMLAGSRAAAVAGGEFTFKVRDKNDPNPLTNVVATGSTTGNTAGSGYEVTFTDIEYSEGDIGKTFYYVVEEDQGTAPGMSYDSEKIELIVTVSDSEAEPGKLAIYAEYADGAPAETNLQGGKPVTFTNSYTASGSLALAGSKTVAGNRSAVIGDGEFLFTVKDYYTGDVKATGKTVNTGSAASTGISFTEIRYTTDEAPAHPLSDTHYGVVDGEEFRYVVTETGGFVPTISYDHRSFTVTVKVTDNGDGTLSAAAVYPSGTELSFLNEYKAEKTIDIDLEKHLMNRHHGIKANEFSFTVTDAATGNPVGHGVSAAAYQEPAAGNSYESISKIIFDCFTYTQDDIGRDFDYVITENTNPFAPITYDALTTTVTVHVRDSADSTGLDVTVDYTSAHKNFTNYYVADGSIAVMGNKYLTGGRPGDIAPGEFDFALYDGTKLVSKGTTYIAGHIHFTPIRFSDAAGADEEYVDGTHEYYVYNNTPTTGKTTLTLQAKEISGTDSTITYSTDVLDVTIEVEDLGGTIYEADVISVKKNGVAMDGIEFTNAYRADGEIELMGTKSVSGGRAADIAAGEFRFNVKNTATGSVASFGKTAAGPVSGADIIFEKLRFTTAPAPEEPEYHTQYDVKDGDVFDYVIAEYKTLDTSIVTDMTVYDVRITAEVKADGTIALTARYDDGTAVKTDKQPTGVPLRYVNEYRSSGNITIRASKVLTGRDVPLKAGEFTFELYDEDGMPVSTASNDAEGNVEFPQLVYSYHDIGKTYVYTIGEQEGTDRNITYSKETFTVHVHVHDGGSGKLKITAEYDTDPTFVNIYTKPKTPDNGGRSSGGGGSSGGPGVVVPTETAALEETADSMEMQVLGASEEDMTLNLLAATGQLWWPIFIMVPAGLMLLAAALYLYLDERKKRRVSK